MILGLILTVLVGALAGWLAGLIMKTSKKDFFANMVLGLCGGLAGSVILGVFGVNTSSYIIGLISSVLGACLLIWIFRCMK